MPRSTSSSSASRVGPPRAACWAACCERRPCFLTQYPTVDGCLPTSRAIDSIERPATSWVSSQSRSMTRTLVRVSDGLLALLQAVTDRVEHLLALGGEGSDGALASRPGGGDLAVEAVEVELEGLEFEGGRGGVELAGAEDDLRDQLGELGGVADDGGRVLEAAPEPLGGEAGERGREHGVEVGGRQLRLSQLRQGDAEREERALGLLAAVDRLAGSVGGARRPAGLNGDRLRAGGPHGALDEIRRDAKAA